MNMFFYWLISHIYCYSVRGDHWRCRLQTECAHYRTIADEAYRLLTDMRDRGILSQSQAGQLCDWLELVDEVCLV